MGGGRPGILGVGTHPDPDLTAPYFAEALAGLREALPGWTVRVNPPEGADAWALLAPAERPGGIPPETPVVVVNGAFAGWPSIDVDNAGAAAGMTDFLCARGHRWIAFVGGKQEMANARERERGFREALARRGLTPVGIWDGRFDRASGRSAMEAWGAGAVRPTAVFAANDHMALGVCEVARDRGWVVAVAGFDDIPEAAEAGLTTVRLPVRALTRRAGEWIARWRREGRGAVPDRDVLPTERVERGSTDFQPKGWNRREP